MAPQCWGSQAHSYARQKSRKLKLDLYSVISTSRDSAEAEPIILRQTATTRLVFKPWLINNVRDPSAPVKGCFVFQKKGNNEDWNDHSTVPLSRLKSGEACKLELSSHELHEFLTHAAGLYRLCRKHGVPKGKTHFLKLRSDQNDVRGVRELDITRWLQIARRAGVDGISGVLEWLSKLDNATEIVSHLARLEVDGLKRINSLVGVTTLRNVVQLWEENQANSSEEFWQEALEQYAFVLSQVFAYPVVLFKGKAYVGNKGLDNTGGHIVDYLLANQLTRNAVLVEIKTPTSKLLGREYRGGGVYPSSGELSGAISQVLAARQSLMKQINDLGVKTPGKVEAFAPTL